MWAARALKRTDVQLTIVSEKPNFQNKCESLLVAARTGSNETKLSDGGRERASLGVGVSKSSQKWSVQRSAVRSIAWLDVIG